MEIGARIAIGYWHYFFASHRGMGADRGARSVNGRCTSEKATLPTTMVAEKNKCPRARSPLLRAATQHISEAWQD
jgi:hypothetical protein